MDRYPVSTNQFLKLGLFVFWACLGMSSFAGSALHCDVTYAGTTYKLKATPTADPYSVQPIEIGGRFFFKMILQEAKDKIDHVLIYAYLDQEPRPLLLQQAKYFGPFPESSKPLALTGLQYLYGGPVERELIYSCSLSTVTP